MLFNKRILVFVNVFIFCIISPYSLVLASNKNINKSQNQVISNEEILNAKLIDPKILDDISIDKKWIITFNQPIEAKSIRGNVKIIDKASKKEIPINISLDTYNCCMEISPAMNYTPDTEYLLIINKLVSKHNKKMKTPLNLNFRTASIISSIKDINISINQEDEYVLPDKLSSKMSNGSVKEVKVTWDKQLESTSIPGNYTYYGKVDGYNKSILLSLEIKPFKPVDSISNSVRRQSQLQTNLYNYMMNNDNRQSVMKRAIELHNGELKNNCVYFSSEALRRTGISSLPEAVCNTKGLTKELKSYGFESSSDLSKLLPGDICFTTSVESGPTHAYIFMKWVEPNSYNYGYVCDNQGNEYGNIYHKRNIDFATEEKEALSYFMYIP